MRLEPINERMIAQEIAAKQVTDGGIHLPQASRRPTKMVKILSQGAGLLSNGERVPFSVSVGDVVMLNERAGQELKDQGDTYLLITERDILAKLNAV